MPATDLDRLSDLAHNASDLADRSNRIDDHAAAAKAHYAAFKAASARGKEDRPSLAATHLRRATLHDRIASQPDSYDRKRVDASRLERHANANPSAENHRTAAKAHDEAAAAWSKENKKQASQPDDPWELRRHTEASKRLKDQAAMLEKHGDDEVPDVDGRIAALGSQGRPVDAG